MAGKNFTNQQVARLLRSVAAAYTVTKGNHFQIAAYETAADAIEHSTSEVKDLWQENKLDTVPGVGAHLISYLDELFRTGKVRHFNSVMRLAPKGMFSLLDVPGIGPKTAWKLARMGVKGVSDLRLKVKSGELVRKGISEKASEKIIQGVEEYLGRSRRMLLPYADNLAQTIIQWLKKTPEVQTADALGSLRRQVATVGDIDIAVCSQYPKKAIDHFLKYDQIKRPSQVGEKKATVVLKNGVQIDLMVQTPDRYGSLLQHFTGSKHHNTRLRKLANEKKLSLSEYGISKLDRKGHQFSQDTMIKCKTEQEFYHKLGLQYIPPELREDSGEIEASQQHILPKLVEIGDIKGDLHVHSSYKIETSHDYGIGAFEEIINKATKLGYNYVGLSDHSPSVGEHSPARMKELINKRTHAIQELKNKYKRTIKVLNSMEIDILADGRLSVPDELLATLDLVLAGVHSSMRQPQSQMTERILRAVENPHVDVITHPTGRLLDKRESYEADWQRIFIACHNHKTALEINAWPQRLDLPDILARDAIEQGVKLVIDTDSHALEHMDNMTFGVAVARRGWATSEDIANSWDWTKFKEWFNIK